MGRIKTPSRIQAEARQHVRAYPSRTIDIDITVRIDLDHFDRRPNESRQERLFRLVAQEHPTKEVFNVVVRHAVAREGEQVVLVDAHEDPDDKCEHVSLCTLVVKHGRPDLLRELLCNIVDDNALRRRMVVTHTMVVEVWTWESWDVWQGLRRTRSWNGSTALHAAIRQKDADSVRLLLLWDGERLVHAHTEDNESPLSLAVNLGWMGALGEDAGLDIVKALLQYSPEEQVRQHSHA
jgi:hypothetical protein